jgi:hypothetical protein
MSSIFDNSWLELSNTEATALLRRNSWPELLQSGSFDSTIEVTKDYAMRSLIGGDQDSRPSEIKVLSSEIVAPGGIILHNPNYRTKIRALSTIVGLSRREMCNIPDGLKKISNSFSSSEISGLFASSNSPSVVSEFFAYIIDKYGVEDIINNTQCKVLDYDFKLTHEDFAEILRTTRSHITSKISLFKSESGLENFGKCIKNNNYYMSIKLIREILSKT